MKARFIALGIAGLILWASSTGGAYWRHGQRWASGSSIVMHLQLGSSGSLLDGSSSWGTSAEGALATWNPYLSGVEFRVVRDSSERIALYNNVNNVFWDNDVYGDSFGDAIAYTKWAYNPSTNVMSEADVVFDNTESWNSYRGNLRRSSAGGWLYDLRRVALHEFGHVLGLAHPDDHGQSVRAIMNSRTSDIDGLQTDDIDGARSIYGSSTPTPNHSPTVTASCSPCTVQIGQSTTLSASASDADGDSLTYRWTASQGSFGNANGSSTSWIAPSQTTTVTATVTVSDGRGGSATSSVSLQVVPRDGLDAGARLLSGQSIVSGNSRYRLAYQSDGNLVTYDDVDRTALWSSGTAGTSPGQALMQSDGNFVIYDAGGAALWSTATPGNANARLVVQNDGNVVIYTAAGQPIWNRLQ